MCGIFGAISLDNNVLCEIKPALKKLAYRGYDSAGVCYIKNGAFEIQKVVGHPEALFEPKDFSNISIGHNRWATHGAPLTKNAHPHLSNDGKIAVVHNGIIENYFELKKELKNKGFSFSSETDTEVIPNLIQLYLKEKNIEDAIAATCNKIRGAFAFVAVSLDEPGRIFAAKLGSPLCIGTSEGSIFISSDKTALPIQSINHTFLEDKTIACCSYKNVKLTSFCGKNRRVNLEKTGSSELEYSLGKYSSFLEKEILEQPIYINSAISGRVNSKDYKIKLAGISSNIGDILSANQIIFTGCGSALYSAEIGAYAMESFAKIPCRSISAGEFKYFDAAIDKNTVVIAVSQSGETADTLGCILHAKKLGATTIGIVNTPGSSIAREVDSGIYIRAGQEKSVASTKAVTNQIIALIQTAILVGEMRGMPKHLFRNIIDDLSSLSRYCALIIESGTQQFGELSNFKSNVVIGRGPAFSVAKEIALKIKELSYIHSEAFSASELKHGPLALISESCPTIVVAVNDGLEEKLLSNIKEIESRGGPTFIIGPESFFKTYEGNAKRLIYPDFKSKIVSSIGAMIFGQIVAKMIAENLSRSLDRPRNLAKSVTVE